MYNEDPAISFLDQTGWCEVSWWLERWTIDRKIESFGSLLANSCINLVVWSDKVETCWSISASTIGMKRYTKMQLLKVFSNECLHIKFKTNWHYDVCLVEVCMQVIYIYIYIYIYICYAFIYVISRTRWTIISFFPS
jgi:hypothetical protein